MNQHREVILTTTTSFEGYEIAEYLGIITSQIVAGTNFLNDILAGLTDFVGGRSGAYQKQLTSLNNEALDILKTKAKKLGANAVVGVKIDYDEISGKNMQMFMVNASGTAVRIEKRAKELNIEIDQIVSKESMSNLLNKQELIESINNRSFKFTPDNWEFIIDNQVQEVIPVIFDILENPTESPYIEKAAYYEVNKNSQADFIYRCYEFFSLIPENKTLDVLYSWMESSGETAKFAIKLINALDLISPERIFNKINSDNFELSKISLELLKGEKKSYVISDIEALEKLSTLIITKFKPRGTTILDKGKEYWICECGQKNSANAEYCSKCKRDLYGFEIDHMKPHEATSILSRKIEILKKAFEHQG